MVNVPEWDNPTKIGRSGAVPSLSVIVATLQAKQKSGKDDIFEGACS